MISLHSMSPSSAQADLVGPFYLLEVEEGSPLDDQATYMGLQALEQKEEEQQRIFLALSCKYGAVPLIMFIMLY